jgi:hypothetical protein
MNINNFDSYNIKFIVFQFQSPSRYFFMNFLKLEFIMEV